MRSVKVSLGAMLLCGALLAAAAFGANVPMPGGAIQLWVTPNPSGNGGGTVLITGVVAAYGTAQKVTASGKPSPKGTYRKVTLKGGTLLINVTDFEKANNNASPTMFNKSNCSAYVAVTAPVAIVSGTGAYAGITGTVALHAENAVILPKTKKGVCKLNANPVNDYVTITGTGTVKFS